MINIVSMSFCLGFFVCFLAIPALSVVARRIGLVDKPGGRKQHEGAVPLVGGIAIFFSILLTAAFSAQINTSLLFSLGALLIIGIYDDFFDMPPVKKLMAQVGICVFLTTTTGVKIKSLGTLPGGVELILSHFGLVLTIIAMVGLVNAINMIDGIDGLAGGLCIMTLLHLVLAMHLINRLISSSDLTVITAATGALAAFLVFNNMPTKYKIFLGDSGSMMLGLFLAYFLIKTSQTRPLALTLPTAMVAWIVALPYFETLSLIVRRMSLGRSPFSPDREHLHYLLIDNGLSARRATLLILSLASIIFWSGFAISRFDGLISGLIFAIMPLFYYALIIHPLKNRLQKKNQLGQVSKTKRKND